MNSSEQNPEQKKAQNTELSQTHFFQKLPTPLAHKVLFFISITNIVDMQ